MPKSLLLAVRFQEGRYHGQGDRFDGAEGWPPSPARLFQALVAASARGATLGEKDQAALRWLECLDPPRIAAPAARCGRTVRLYVPNNDLDSVGGDPHRVSEIRVLKPWRPWFFDHEDPVLYVWDFGTGMREAERICAVAARLYQLGRGIDMAWAIGRILDRDKADAMLESQSGPVHKPAGAGETATPRRGTLDSLAKRYQRTRTRLAMVVTDGKLRQLFTKPPMGVFARTGYDRPSHRLHFELRTAEGNFAPQPLHSAARLLTSLLKGATHRLQNALPDRRGEFERLIIGRGAGPQDLAQRVRLVPVPSVGTEHADLSIRRVVVNVPAACPIRIGDLKWAFAGRRHFTSTRTGEGLVGRLVSTADSHMADRYARAATEFRSITSVALPLRPRHRGAGRKDAADRIREEGRAVGAILEALRHASIRTRPTDIRVQREPFHKRGVRAESFAVGSRFSQKELWHVQLRFQEPVRGPLLIGNGRFCGLGLMEPGPS